MNSQNDHLNCSFEKQHVTTFYVEIISLNSKLINQDPIWEPIYAILLINS